MIEMLEYHRNELEERLYKEDYNDMKLVPDGVNLEDLHNTSSGFTDSRMVVMLICIDSAAAAESGSGCSFVEVVREAATSVVGEVIVVEEALNSIVVAVRPNIPQSTATAVQQLIAITGQVVYKVYTVRVYMRTL